MEMDPQYIKQLIRQVISEELRIGAGIDFHSLYEDYSLVLAGVTIPHNKGFHVKRSDGDPVSHAIVDALLAAMGKGDIADWFSDQDGITDARSIEYLGELHKELLLPQAITLISVQVIVLAEQPKLKPFFLQMQTHIAKQLHIDEERVNIQGKTFEGKGIIGQQEGIAVEAIVALLLPSTQ
jgi:2-C-methyl-D-erythritol 2,4-cyclodiphosphate synthase